MLCRSASGKVVQRSVRQLSGGERRRVALALALGFAELASARTGLRCNLLVLDEVNASTNQSQTSFTCYICGYKRRSLTQLVEAFRHRLACLQVLQQLDEEGCARVSKLLRSMPQANILVVGQADSYVMKVCHLIS